MSGKNAKTPALIVGLLLSATAVAGWIQLHRAPVVPTIALIPQTAGAMLWEVEHLGATVAAEQAKCRLYWNAPTSENDVAGQVSAVDRVVRSRYQGLVIAPNHPLSILAPLRRAAANGLPVVVVSAQLDLPATPRLGYLVNDDPEMGRMAAAEIAALIHGRGAIALVGIARIAPGVMTRVRSAEEFLASRFPDIRIVSRLPGAFDNSRSEELTKLTLDSHPDLKAILSFTSNSTRGVHAAIESRSLGKTIPLVGCEQDSDLIAWVDKGEIAAILAENTYLMGYRAVGLISAALAGTPLPARSVVPPVLITRHNITSPEANLVTGFIR